MRKLILATLITVGCRMAAPSDAAAQSIAGTWKGQITDSAYSLHVTIHIRDSSGQLTATIDSPDQQVYGTPASMVSFQLSHLVLTMKRWHIRYEGQLAANGDTLRGTFTQSGHAQQLTLIRANEMAVQFRNPDAGITLSGTLSLPSQTAPFPAVVLISGSGPQDRDETLFGHKPFGVLADYLTRRGIAVLRFDDRGTAASGGDFSTATTADFAGDARAALAYLRTRKEINPAETGLIGHSEGGLIASMVAASDKQIAFIVLLAGPGIPSTEVLISQEAAMAKAMGVDSAVVARDTTRNRRIFRLICEDTGSAALRDSLSMLVASALPKNLDTAARSKAMARQMTFLLSPWLRYFLRIDPAEYLSRVSCPVLALDGSHDLQVLPEPNIRAIRSALTAGGNTNLTTRIFPGLNHLFQTSRTGLPGEYASIRQSFAPKALTVIARWIRGVTDH